MKRMPRVLGPQWEETVHPARVSMIWSNSAYLAMARRTASTAWEGALE